MDLKDYSISRLLIKRFKTNTAKLGESVITFETEHNRIELLEKYWESILIRHRTLSSFKEVAIDIPYFQIVVRSFSRVSQFRA